jgi:argininosuccinate lyase
MSKLWQTVGSTPSEIVEAYTVGEDYIFDTLLLPYDIEGTLAHVAMLVKIGVLEQSEYDQVAGVLQEIKELHQKGEFKVLQEQEDCHTAIEQYVTEKLGDIGKKIHTGRSRNDQALVMVRLYMKVVLAELSQQLQTLRAAYEEKAQQAKDIPMPGYTHLQKAMPTTVSSWLGAYRDAFQDLIPMVQATQAMVDQNPLGSAAGFGVTGLELDREFTTEKLGFAKTQKNPLYCGLSRGYFELVVLQACELITTLSGRFACDMLLFTTQEFDYLSLPPEFTTGSSIMPNKRNYDLFEIMRGNTKVIAGYRNQIQMIVGGIGGGYQRDLALTKEPFMKGSELTKSTLTMLTHAIPELKINEPKLKAAMTDDLYATEKVYQLVAQGMPFRDAYKQIKEELFPPETPETQNGQN